MLSALREPSLASATIRRRTPLFAALALLGLVVVPECAFAATTWPVSKCDDRVQKGGDTLRIAIGKAVDGDIVDMGALPVTCSTITLTGGQIPIPQQNLSIWGPSGRTVTVTAGNNSRVFYHGGGGALTLRDFEVAYGSAGGSGGCVYSKGFAALDHMIASMCHASQAGGAVAAQKLTLFYSKILGSSAGVAGGGVAAFGSDTAHLDHSTISGNTAALGGGAYAVNVEGSNTTIANNQADSGGGLFATGLAALSYSVVSNNIALSGGGGANAGRSYVYSSRVSGNSADFGGGVAAFGRTYVRYSTVDGNVAVHKGGGLYVKSAAAAAAAVYNSTISGNVAGNGGGAYLISTGPTISSGAARVFNSTVAFNQSQSGPGGIWIASPTIVFYSSILANNGAQDFGASQIFVHTTTAVASLIMNAQEIPAGTLRDDPRLVPLALHGGQLPTHALSSTSPAINHGANPKNFAFDERGSGYVRVEAIPDIGAYEVQLGDDELFYGGFQ